MNFLVDKNLNGYCFDPEDDSYSHIGRSDSIGSGRLSIGSFSTSMDRTDGYNSIERHSSFGSRNEEFPPSSGAAAANYDSIDHARSQINLSVKEGHAGRLNRSPSGYSHISSVSNILYTILVSHASYCILVILLYDAEVNW